MCGLYSKQDVHIGFSFQGINTGHWTLGRYDISQYYHAISSNTINFQNGKLKFNHPRLFTRTDQSASSAPQPGSTINMDRQILNRNHREFC